MEDFHLTVAADYGGIGCVLSQTDLSGCERPIGFASTMLSDAETRYNGVEKTILALRLGARKWRHLMTGRFVGVFTKDPHLNWALTNKNHQSRTRKWMYDLGDIRFKVETTQKEVFPAELLLGRRSSVGCSGARKGPSFVWPPMSSNSVIVTSDGGHRSDQVNGYGLYYGMNKG